MATPPKTINLIGVISETNRIMKAHSRHFQALYALFLQPLSFSLVIYPSLHFSLSHNPINPTTTQFLLHLAATVPLSETLILAVVFTILIALLSISAFATISYSTYHGFYGRPINLGSAIKFLLHSFFPLVATALSALIVASLISFLFFFAFEFVTKTAGFLGFNVDNDSNCYIWLSVLFMIGLGLVLVCLLVHWAMASAIVVAESEWGFKALRRSANLVRGMKSASLLIVLLSGWFSYYLIWPAKMIFSGGSIDWMELTRTVLNSICAAFFMLNYVSANTVLYIFCKALHGELGFFEIGADEFGNKYISLPLDDDTENVPQDVTVAHA